MPKLSMKGLNEIKEKHKATFTLRAGGYRAKVTIHMGQCGIAAGALNVMLTMMEEISKANITDVLLTKSSCGGLCVHEPIVTVELINQAPVKYCDLNAKKVRKIFREHILGGKLVEKYALAVGCENSY